MVRTADGGRVGDGQQRLMDFLGGGPRGRVGGHAAGDEGVHLGGAFLGDSQLAGLPPQRALPGHNLPQHDAERVDVHLCAIAHTVIRMQRLPGWRRNHRADVTPPGAENSHGSDSETLRQQAPPDTG